MPIKLITRDFTSPFLLQMKIDKQNAIAQKHKVQYANGYKKNV